jgi:hypothetical protein
MREVHALAELLDRERVAAAHADVDTLSQLQDLKRAALERLRRSGAPASVVAPLAAQARANLALMRHLVHCLRGLAGEEGALYTPSGAAQCASSLHVRAGVRA